MKELPKRLKNAFLIISGFFVVLLGYSKLGDMTRHNQGAQRSASLMNSFDGVANAEVGDSAGSAASGDSSSGGDSACK